MNRIRLKAAALTICSALLLLAGCINIETRTGVDNIWRNDSAVVVEVDVTTRADIIKMLGPPSQVIAAGDQLILYYLLEERKRKGMILLVYNRTMEKVTYDRAIFFFNGDSVLEDFAFSRETVRYDPTQ
jgi:hypothetical protein